MNEKQKAKELVEEFIDLLPYSNRVYETAKKCALICVDEILNEPKMVLCGNGMADNYYKIWQNVKTEIQNFEP